ncbi:YfhO family protein [Flaviaesturariibacter terrae]
MKKGLLVKLLPHLVAVVVFLLVAVLYCKPALQGMVLSQHDIIQWKGGIHQSELYKETHGKYPLWTNSMFSGMPAFQVGSPGNNIVPWLVHDILTLHLPAPIQFFFLACICFYILCLCLRINPWIGIFGSLSFAYATYNPVIISVGHDTKMWSIAYMPALLGSILLIFNRRYWLGAGLTALFTSVLVAMNHPQIDYYLFLTLGIMGVFFIVRWLREKQYIHLFKALGLTLVAGAIGLLVNAVTILSTYEYQKETIRGGASEITGTKQGDAKDGLDKEYAFSYSFGLGEPVTMFLPHAYGAHSPSNNPAVRPVVEDDKSKTAQFLSEHGQSAQGVSYYWGNLSLTSGPPYIGIVVCLLALLGFFILDDKHRWWVLAATVLAILMSWGSNFMGFNTFLYDHLPMYNKFRAPSMILVIPQLLFPFMAVLTLDKLASTDFAVLRPRLKQGLIGIGVLFLFFFVMYAMLDYMSLQEHDALKAGLSNPQQAEGMRQYFDALKSDRQSLFMGDIFRALGFGIAAAALVWMLLKRILKPAFVFAGFALLSLIDLLPIDSNYINSDSFMEDSSGEVVFSTTDTDRQILADKSYYRVFDVSGNAFADAHTSYHYNSVGGYHAVKLRIYQDLIENQLAKGNMAVVNMLNVKYLIQKDQGGNTTGMQQNPGALGPAWFVKNLVFVKDAKTEMSSLDHFNPRDTAFARAEFQVPSAPTQFSGEGSIVLEKNDNDVITYNSNSPSAQFAVFSEIYYKAGWKAFVDGKETPIAKVDYALRGLQLPAGAHRIEFRFEPQGFYRGYTITTICQVLLALLLLAGVFLEWRSRHRESEPA